MSFITNNIVTILLSVSVLALSFLYFTAVLRLRSLTRNMFDIFFKNAVLTQIVENSNLQSDDAIHKENFIKFLSDSRDWAFDYIESSQTTIKEVLDNFDKIEHKELYDKLKKLLPEVTDDRR